MKGIKFYVLFACIVVFNFCVRARVSSYPGFNYPPGNPNSIQIFNIPPSVSFEIIGEVESRGAPTASWEKVENHMKIEAAKIGGDAIVLIDKRERYTGSYVTPSKANAFVYGNYIYYTYQPGASFAMRRKHIIGLVIKWK